MVRGSQPALFLDRDGVVNEDAGYVGTRDRFTFLPGIFPLARRAQDLGYRLVVVTNQAGIARGFYTEGDFHDLTRWMSGVFAVEGVALAGVFYCPFHPQAAVPAYHRDSYWRKPAPGMVQEAAQRFGLAPSRSVLLGDQVTDMGAARAAGVAYPVLVAPTPPDPLPEGVALAVPEPGALIPWLQRWL